MSVPTHEDVAALLRQLMAAVDAGATPAELADEARRLAEAVRATDLRDADTVTTRYLLAGAIDVQSSTVEPHEMALLRGGLETIRQALERLMEREELADSRPLADVVQWTLESLNTDNKRLAQLLGVQPRTVANWLDRDAPTAIETEEMRRARRLAQVVRQLRHVLSSNGTIAWLCSPQESLKGMRPVDILSEAAFFDDLLGLASRGRSQVAS